MRLVRPYFEIIEQQPGLEGIYRQIELAGRVSHKSEDKMTEHSSKEFVDRMIELGHGAVLEHGTVYLHIAQDCPLSVMTRAMTNLFTYNPYSKVNRIVDTGEPDPSGTMCPGIKGYDWYITTNLRVLLDNNMLHCLDSTMRCELMEQHERRIAVRFVCDRGITHELVRHRTFSFLQESTRYCNYSQGKFNSELTFIIPSWYFLKEGHYKYVHETGPLGHDFCWTPEVSLRDLENGAGIFLDCLSHSETAYFEIMDKWHSRIQDRRYRTGYKGNPLTPQQARELLPNALKSEIIMTGFVSDWWGEYKVYDKETGEFLYTIPGKDFLEVENVDKETHRVEEKGFFPLRCSKAAHPQMRELAVPLRAEFIKRDW